MMLPSDRYLAELLGLSDEQYDFWREEVRLRAAQGPRPAVVAGLDPVTAFIVQVVISVGLSLLASALTPRQNQGAPAQLNASNQTGESQNSLQAFAPRVGFNSTQDVAALGEPIPVVYANRETIGGITYGGVRTNTTLLWSQILSLGGSQMLRAVFMLAEGRVASIDPEGFAIGDSSISTYDLGSSQANEIGSRITIYYRANGGRISSADRILGRAAAADSGNAVNAGAADAFQVRSIDNAWRPDFCASSKPATSTTFGVYTLIGNDLGYKLNPKTRPVLKANLIPEGTGGDARVVCDLENTAVVERAKYRAFFSTRSGITSGTFAAVNDIVTYKLLRSSDFATVFQSIAGAGGVFFYSEGADDAASSVASRQKAWDDAIVVGDLYKIGSALAVCVGRSPANEVFRSDADLATAGSGQSIDATFRIVRPGVAATTTEAQLEAIGTNNQIAALTTTTAGVAAFASTYTDVQLLQEGRDTGGRATVVVPAGGGFNSSAITITAPGNGADGSAVTLANGNPNGGGEHVIAARDLAVSVVLSGTPRLVLPVNVPAPRVGSRVSFTTTGTLPSPLAVGTTYHVQAVPSANEFTVSLTSGGAAVVITTTGTGSLTCTQWIRAQVFTADSSTDRLTASTTAPVVGTRLQITSDGTMPAPLTTGTIYHVVANPTTTTMQLSTTADGAAIDITSDGSGEIRALIRGGTDWAGTATLGTVSRKTATSGPHILRIAMASGATSRECRVVELGFRSSLGIRYNGIMRFRTTLTFADTDGRACSNALFFTPVISSGQTLKVDNYQSGTVVGPDERYSFFRFWYKKQSESAYTPLAQVFGFAGVEQQAMFNYLRLQWPSQDSWEWDIEPLSGWEIRNIVTDANLYVIDSRLADVITVDTTTGGRTVRATFNGRTVSRSQSTFRLQQTERADIGLPHPDTNNNYADAWGKLAEAFVYDEIQSSATQPEHEIVYVNEIVENAAAPLYDGIALIGVNAASSYEWQQFSQLSPYVTGGDEVRRLLNSLSEGPSHLLPDLALDRLTNPKYGPGNITDDLINLANFQTSAQWCYDRRYFFDGGVIISQESPRQWIADHAAFMLLDFREVNGGYDLVPQITFGVVSHAALFTAGNIAEGTFKFETIALEDRQASQISAKWRQERSSTNPANPGMFPTEREVLVREAAPYGSDTMPIEAIDLSGFCTNENHAIDVAKFTLRMRRLRDHAISFETTYDGLEGITTGVGPGDMIRVAMDATAYDEFNNGVVTADGTVVSSQPLANGSYDVVSWGGSGAVNDAGTLTVSNGIGSPAGIVFTIKRTSTLVRSYQITKISPTEDGAYRIEALHMPTDASGRMLVAADWNEAGAWVIQR